jgi:hypothetical protein
MSKLIIKSSYITNVLIIIIIICIIYLIYGYFKSYNVYESFDNTQRSLAVYYQNTVDSDPFTTRRHRFNGVNINPKPAYTNNWDGIWRNEDQYINAQFIQKNDDIIISMSNYSFDYLNIIGRDENGCSDNLFLGRARLNNDKTVFTLNKIICKTYINKSIIFEENKLTGKLDKSTNTISLYSEGIAQPVILTMFQAFSNSSKDFKNYEYSTNYIKKNDPFATATGTIPDSNFVYEENFCENPDKYQPCIDNAHGLVNIGYDDSPYNACGTRGEGGFCTDGPNNSGICTIAPVDGFEQCKKISHVYDYMNFMPSLELSKMNGNTSALCEHLKYFSDSKCNSCIITYVENVGNVQTLNYEFSGVKKDQNSLTLQYDMINTIINRYLLKKFRDLIAKNIKSTKDERMKSFINCYEENHDGSVLSEVLETCTEDVRNALSNYKDAYVNPLLSPAIWQLQHSVSNSCSFTLNTHPMYRVQEKYVQCNNDGSTSLSLYKGGENQKMIFENPVIVNKVDSDKYPFIALTANIRAYNKLYLLPSPDNAGLHNGSHKVRLSSKPNPSGRWLIIGLTLSNFNNLKDDLKDRFMKASKKA